MILKRHKKVLNQFLHSDNCIKGSELADLLNVSSRTIRTDIQVLNDTLEKHSIKIQASKQKGYYITEKDREILNKLIETEENKFKIPSASVERIIFILLKLAFSNEYISMQNFSEMMFVSKATVNLDLKKILGVLVYFPKLKLEVSKINGIKLKGDEISKRLLLTSILNKDVTKDIMEIIRRLNYIFSESNLNSIIIDFYRVIINILEDQGYLLNDEDVISLAIDFYISIKRIEMGFLIKENIEISQESNIIESITKEIKKLSLIEINENEFNFLQQRFYSKRILHFSNNNIRKNKESEKIIFNFLKEIKEKFYIDLLHNENLKNSLEIHITPMINRLRNGIFQENPLQEDIRKKYPLAFEISNLMLPIIKEHLDIWINESELAYLAIHIAAALEETNEVITAAIICDSGLGTAQLIKQKIERYFGERIKVLGYYSHYQLEKILEKNKEKIHLLISTVPLEVNTNLHVIKIQSLISKKDLEKINNYINPIVRESNESSKKIIHQCFNPRLFKYFGKEINDYHSILYKLTENLFKEGFIDDTDVFYKSILERENMQSTVLVDYISLPHTMGLYARTTILSTGILEKPILYNEKKIKLIMLFAINPKEKEKLKALYEMIESVLESDNRNKIINSKTFEELLFNMDVDK